MAAQLRKTGYCLTQLFQKARTFVPWSLDINLQNTVFQLNDAYGPY